jgi:hypothetical protein
MNQAKAGKQFQTLNQETTKALGTTACLTSAKTLISQMTPMLT